jgi:CubicO group peptidase (beta-lactamase class C family)
LIVLTASVAPATARGQVPAPEQFQSVRRTILERLRADSIPSLSLAVVKDGRIVWEEALGYLDVESRVLATTTTRYPIGSVSKSLTATALMVQVQEGRLALEGPANQYLEIPGIRAEVGQARDVTLERLATHTSGIPRHDMYYYADEPHHPLPIAERIRRYGRVVRVPGESYEYSNLGYDILAHVIARGAGRAFGDVLRETVLEPLGMVHTSLGPPATSREEVARGYDDHRRVTPIREDPNGGAGGVYGTAGDLVRFGMLHLGRLPGSGPPILSTSMLVSMREPRVHTEVANGTPSAGAPTAPRSAWRPSIIQEATAHPRAFWPSCPASTWPSRSSRTA